MSEPVIAWWSGGVASAVTCRLVLKNCDNVRLIFIDTRNEHPDTYRFMADCEAWYSRKIETIAHPEFTDIRQVWRKHNSLNVATGAICSTILKRRVREMWEKENAFSAQAFGFDIDEKHRADAMAMNYPKLNPFFPLLDMGMSKASAMTYLLKAGIRPPEMYYYGFENNNCFGTGCVQGGIGYWQKIMREFPEKFAAMADMEHELTTAKGAPVTMLKYRGGGGNVRLFLKPHPDYTELPHIGMVEGREPKNLLECNGFCGANDFEQIDMFNDLNLEDTGHE